MKRQAVVGSQGSVTRSVGARYGLRGTVGEASQPGPPSLSRHRSVRRRIASSSEEPLILSHHEPADRPRVPSRRVVLVQPSPEGNPQSVQDIDVAQSSTVVDLDDLIPTAVEGSDTDSVADALERDVVVDADVVQRNVDEDVMSEAGSAVEEESNPEEPVELIVPQRRPLRDALIALDAWSLQELVSKRAAVMKNVPRVVKGPFRNALQFALEEATATERCRQERGWTLFLLLPRMLLHRPPRGGLISKEKLGACFQLFAQGQWAELLAASATCDEQAAMGRRRRRRVNGDDLERRAKRAELLVGMGELSSARQALEGAELAQGRMKRCRCCQTIPRDHQRFGNHCPWRSRTTFLRSRSSSHTLQGLTELNPRATVVSIDGISAHDLVGTSIFR